MFVRNLLYPERYYDEDVPGYGLKWEVLVLLVIGGIASIGYFVVVQMILDEFALGASQVVNERPPMSDNTARQLRFRILYPVLEIFALWGIYTVVYYVGSWFFSGHGTIFSLAKNTAWALVPFLFANVLVAVGIVFAFTGQEIDTDLPGLPERNVQFLLDQGLTQLPMIVVPLIKIAFVAWIAYIGAAAIQDAMGIDRERALQIAAIPAVLHAGYLLWEALGRAGIA